MLLLVIFSLWFGHHGFFVRFKRSEKFIEKHNVLRVIGPRKTMMHFVRSHIISQPQILWKLYIVRGVIQHRQRGINYKKHNYGHAVKTGHSHYRV